MQVYKRIALLGSIANPNIGDEAILTANLQLIRKMYGTNCKVYIFSKDASYTSLFSSEPNLQIIPVDYLHRISVDNHFDIAKIEMVGDEIVSYESTNSGGNFLYEAIHCIFKEIDILHIVGGGYLNSLWPDMLYEAIIAARLALKYSKKYIMTGISAYPLDEKYEKEFIDLCRNAEFVDFRDNTSVDILEKSGIKYQISVDDAINMHSTADLETKNYANFLIHNWDGYSATLNEKVRTVLIPFMEECIKNDFVEYVNILGFSDGDLEIWNEFKNDFSKELKSRIAYIDLTLKNSISAKNIISNAKFNIGSRFHIAVFSLSANVPVCSIYFDSYYENKIGSIHSNYKSNCFVSIEELTIDMLKNFIETLHSIKEQLISNNDTVYKKYLMKCQRIAESYGINQVDSELLYNKLCGQEKAPKISVIIPIYNMDAYLPVCLDSVLNQTLNELEIICVNDGSTDYSQQILNEYSWKDERIKVINQTNHGVAYSRNIAMEAARGEFLFFLDPDDWLPDENTFLDMYDTAKKNNVLICGGTFKEYAPRGIIDEWSGNLCKYNFEEEGLMNYSDYQFDYGWVRFIYNREFIIYNNLRIPSLKFFEDPVFFVKVMHQAKVFYRMKRCTYCYRTGHKSFELPYEKVLDLVKGLSENISLAIEYNYGDLLALEIARIENDYAEHIYKHLVRDENVELRELFSKLNKQVFDNNNRIEYRMYQKIIANKNALLYQHQQNSDSIRNEFYSSTTWRVGHLVLFIPKWIKKHIFRRPAMKSQV